MPPVYFDGVRYQEGVEPCYRVGGIAAAPEMVRGPGKALDELSEERFEVFTLSKDAEFHAKEIFNGNRNLRNWTNIENAWVF